MNSDVESLRADVRRTRAELTETVAEIATRVNVRAQVRRKLADPRSRRTIIAAVVAGLAIVVAYRQLVRHLGDRLARGAWIGWRGGPGSAGAVDLLLLLVAARALMGRLQ